MSEFLTRLQVEVVSEEMYVLTAPLIYRSDVLGSDITVPNGFATDFASVPEFLPIIHTVFAGEGKAAAVVHDWLLVEGKLRRETADEVFLEALKCCSGVGWKAKPMYYAVKFWTWLNGLWK